MSASVDVLAVLDRLAAASHDPDGGKDFADIDAHAARAAVAELIEADEHFDAMVSRRSAYPCPGMDEHVEKAKRSRAAALARVRGAA